MAINKSNTEYYNLEKVAEVLSVPTAEVNRLREQSKLRGFRDGANWKFNKEEVHTYLADSIRARNGNGKTKNPGESDFDLEESASASSFDLLMEEAALPDDSDLVAVSSSARPPSDLDLAALDHDSDLALAEETQISSLVVPKKAKAPVEPASEVIMDDEDSSALVLAEPDSYVVDDESVLTGGSSPQLGLAGDSGFDVLLTDEDSSNVLQVEEEKTEISSVAAAEFELEPSQIVAESDDSESSSQVIAVDVGLAAQEGTDPFGHTFDVADFAGFDSGISVPSEPTSGDPFSSAVGIPDDFNAAFTPVAAVSSRKPAARTEEYSTGMLVSLASILVVMLLPGLMLLDTMIHVWSWNEPFLLNSILMNTIAGWFGL